MPDAAAWSVAARPAVWQPASPLAARFADQEDLAELAASLQSDPAAPLDPIRLVPRQRMPDRAPSGTDPDSGPSDQDATTTSLPAINDPILVGPAGSAAGGSADVGSAAVDSTVANNAWDRLTAAWAEADSADGGRTEAGRQLPVRRAAGWPGHGQPRRAAGSHRAARARPAERSGR